MELALTINLIALSLLSALLALFAVSDAKTETKAGQAEFKKAA